MLLSTALCALRRTPLQFQRAPTLGGECYVIPMTNKVRNIVSFNGHPPLGVNATRRTAPAVPRRPIRFQRAPTLGGECYERRIPIVVHIVNTGFNGHPPLGVNATRLKNCSIARCCTRCFNGHPPLGVNATVPQTGGGAYQYNSVSTGTHPWG